MNSIPSSITVTIPGTYGGTGDKILVIKSLRTLGGFGLKEAKDLSETVGTHTFPVVVREGTDYVTGQTMSALVWFRRSVDTLRQNGVLVQLNNQRGQTLEAVRRLASEAVLKDDFDVAQALLDVLRRFS